MLKPTVMLRKAGALSSQKVSQSLGDNLQEIRDTFLGVPIIRIMRYWVYIMVSPNLGDY